MDLSTINWLAVAVAAVSAFALGAVWYNPAVFGTSWMAGNKLSKEELQTGNSAKIFGFAFFFSVLMSVNLAMFLNDPKTDLAWGATAGFLAGIWTFSAIAIHSLFELKSWKVIFINGCYSIVSLTIMGAILGGWR